MNLRNWIGILLDLKFGSKFVKILNRIKVNTWEWVISQIQNIIIHTKLFAGIGLDIYFHFSLWPFWVLWGLFFIHQFLFMVMLFLKIIIYIYIILKNKLIYLYKIFIYFKKILNNFCNSSPYIYVFINV